jgi:hypothetical protein
MNVSNKNFLAQCVAFALSVYLYPAWLVALIAVPISLAVSVTIVISALLRLGLGLLADDGKSTSTTDVALRFLCNLLCAPTLPGSQDQGQDRQAEAQESNRETL